MEWKKVKLGEVCDLIAGFAFKASDFGDYPQKVVKIGDINPPHVTYASMSGIDLSKYDVKKLEKFKVQYGDYVLAMTGATIGKVGKYIDSAFSYLNQRVLMFKPKPEVDAQFVNYVVCSAYFRQYVMNHIDSESAQPNISATTIGKYEFLLPSLDEQHRIAAILSSLDDKIENNNRINRNLEAQAQALYKSWFVDFEPFGGTMPEDWKVLKFEDFIRPSTEKVGERIVPEYSVTNNGIIPRAEKFNKKLSKDSSSNKVLRKGNLVFGMSRDILNWGIMEEEMGGVSSAYNIYIIDESQMLPLYLRLYMSSRINEFGDLIGVASREGQGLDKLALRSKKIFYPTPEILGDFLAKYNAIIRAAKSTQQENQRLATLRDTLLPKLMKGEIEL